MGENRCFGTMLVGLLRSFVLQAVVLVPLAETPEGQEALPLLEQATLAALEEAEIPVLVAVVAGRLDTLATEGQVAILAVRLERLAAQGLGAAVAAVAAELFTL